jgi:purine nucleosidase
MCPCHAVEVARNNHLSDRLETRQSSPACPGLPRDIINFQHDPLACAIALGWRRGVEIETVPLKFEQRAGWLHEIPDRDGIPTRIVTKIDANAFDEYWCELLCG